jgi:hypothetical protein
MGDVDAASRGVAVVAVLLAVAPAHTGTVLGASLGTGPAHALAAARVTIAVVIIGAAPRVAARDG